MPAGTHLWDLPTGIEIMKTQNAPRCNPPGDSVHKQHGWSSTRLEEEKLGTLTFKQRSEEDVPEKTRSRQELQMLYNDPIFNQTSKQVKFLVLLIRFPFTITIGP
ncbi:hypothetical protein FQR65_LT02446 [Abscondita terminalis]|nr:hypothetical protein FQR65_LT02446 [Abscondita terminalis]